MTASLMIAIGLGVELMVLCFALALCRSAAAYDREPLERLVDVPATDVPVAPAPRVPVP